MLIVDPINFDVTIDRGDDAPLAVAIVDSSGNPLNCTGATFKYTVKDSIDDGIGAAKFQKLSTVGADFDLSGIATGNIQVLFLPADTASLAGDYVADLEMTLAGKVRTILPAHGFYVRKDATTPGIAPSPPSVLVPFPGDIQIIGGQLYLKDLGVGVDAGKYWKLRMIDGDMDWSGPSLVVPF